MNRLSVIIVGLALAALTAFYLSDEGTIDSELNQEYVYWAQIMTDNGIDISRSESLRVLNYAEMGADMAGRSNKFSNLIYVNALEKGNPMTVRAIVWHELGHYTFDLEHGECRLMDAERHTHEYYAENWRNLETEYISLLLEK